MRERLLELQNQAGADNRVTIESICKELDDACNVARAKGQAAAMVSASALRAKLAGLGLERQQIEFGGPGDFSRCKSTEEVAGQMADELLRYENWWQITEQDRRHLAVLCAEALQVAMQRINDYIAGIKRRPPSKLALAAPSVRQNRKGASA